MMPGRNLLLASLSERECGLPQNRLTRPPRCHTLLAGPVTASSHEITALLRSWSAGEPGARDRLMPIVYRELRRRAAAQLRRERRGDTLQPTALVHEAYLRLVNQREADWHNRAQFFAMAAEIMRRILVDRARARQAAKRSGLRSRVTLTPVLAAVAPADVDVLDLHRALLRLAECDVRKSRVAELRFFGGLSLRETAEVLDVSVATVERDWQVARAWLFGALTERAGRDA
jgi:RNA polymerase sigma factor (TIGR02999 family)